MVCNKELNYCDSDFSTHFNSVILGESCQVVGAAALCSCSLIPKCRVNYHIVANFEVGTIYMMPFKVHGDASPENMS